MKNQTINCTVTSCKYNSNQKQLCQLDTIIVSPCKNCNTAKTDESQCSSYECNN